jgi:hypothetical protein
MVSVDSTTVEAKGGLVGYDGFKHEKGTKIHAYVNKDSMPLRIAIRSGNEHDSRRLLELIEGLEAWAALRRCIIRYEPIRLRIHGHRA